MVPNENEPTQPTPSTNDPNAPPPPPPTTQPDPNAPAQPVDPKGPTEPAPSKGDQSKPVSSIAHGSDVYRAEVADDWRTALGTVSEARNAAGRRVRVVAPHPMHAAAMTLRGWKGDEVVSENDYRAALDAAGKTTAG